MKFYVQLTEENIVAGYASSPSNAGKEFEIEEEQLPTGFETAPFFFRFEEETKTLVFDENLKKAKLEEIKNTLTPLQRLGQKISDLEIQQVMAQQMAGMPR